MDPSACRVVYIDDRFNTERTISRDASTPVAPRKASYTTFEELPQDLQANINAFLSVFNQVFVCHSGRSFSSKLGELHDDVKPDCTPILACFDVGSESKLGLGWKDHFARVRTPASPTMSANSPLPSPTSLKRQITFSSESDESYGLQLLSRIASDLQVEEGVQLIIPVAIVRPRRKDSYDQNLVQSLPSEVAKAQAEDASAIIDPPMMLQCLEAGALDVVKSPLDKAGIMGLTVHAYRIYKNAKREQAGFMAATRGRKQSWVGMDEERPYAYLREAMVKKLLKGICEPQQAIEDYQHREAHVDSRRKAVIANAVGQWGFDGHDFSEDELVYAGYYMLKHALHIPELEHWRISQGELLRFMQGCRVAYNSFVLYHNFRHAVDVLQSLFYFLVQIGALPPYPIGAAPPPQSQHKSAVAKLIGPFEAMTLLISAIGHDVGHPGVNNMFLVKLNAPLAQLYNDQSVLEAFHCAAYSQILRRHWPAAFNDKAIRRLMISSILATDMGVHSDYMQQMGNLQQKIHDSDTTDGWSPKDVDSFRVLTCGLLIKCADISNVARPWAVAEKWTHLLQKEFANQGEMEAAVGMETTLFGGPPELGNMLKLANGQIGFMTIFAHPLFANVADIIPAMSFAGEEILTNKGVWFTRAEKEKMRHLIKKGTGFGDGGAVSPRSLSPVGHGRKAALADKEPSSYFPSSPLSQQAETSKESRSKQDSSVGPAKSGNTTPQNDSRRSSLAAVAGIATPLAGKDVRSSMMGPKSPTRSKDAASSADNVTNGVHTSGDVLKAGESKLSGSSENEKPTTHSDTALQTSTGMDGAHDSRRDEAVSMRAGSTAIPLAKEEQDQLRSRTQTQNPREALEAFNFATSDKDEPVRTYNPEKEYSAVQPGARASAPAKDIEQARKHADVSDEGGKLKPSKSDTLHERHEPGQNDGASFSPSQPTGGHDYLSDMSSESTPQLKPEKSDFETARNRAASAPQQLGSPELAPSFSMDSTQSGSRGSSKNEAQATVLSNGDMASENGSGRDYRKDSTRSVGRKRSRIKLGQLAFWKKKGSERDIRPEEDRQSNDGRSIGAS